MKKRYFYVIASFMRKDVENTRSQIDLTFMNENGSALFPLMKSVEAINEAYSRIADLTTIQFESCFEISKEDYDAYNEFKGLKKIIVGL